MASSGLLVALFMALAATLLAAVSAQSNGCTTAIVSLSPCLSYITGNSTTPAATCCLQLANVVKSEPQCLCTVLGGGASQLGLTINQTQALALPGACNVQTPPVSQCQTVGVPTASPATPTSPSTPSVPGVPGGTGSKTTPGTSDGSSTNMSFSLASFLLFLGSLASTTLTNL